MSDRNRRSLLRHGAGFLLMGAVLGLVTAAPVSAPAKWMTAHVTALLTGLLLIGTGLVWNDLTLSERARRIAYLATLIAAWAGLALNVHNAVLNVPGPATEPTRPIEGVAAYTFWVLLAIVVPATLASVGVVWYGLRGEPTAAAMGVQKGSPTR